MTDPTATETDYSYSGCDCDLLADDTSSGTLIPCPTCSKTGLVGFCSSTVTELEDCDDANRLVRRMATSLRLDWFLSTDKFSGNNDVSVEENTACHSCNVLASVMDSKANNPNHSFMKDLHGPTEVFLPESLTKRRPSNPTILPMGIPTGVDVGFKPQYLAKPIERSVSVVSPLQTPVVQMQADRFACLNNIVHIALGILVAMFHFHMMLANLLCYQIKIVPLLLSFACGMMSVYGLAVEKEDHMLLAALLHIPRIIEGIINISLCLLDQNNRDISIMESLSNVQMSNVNTLINWDLHPILVIIFNMIFGIITFKNFKRICKQNIRGKRRNESPSDVYFCTSE